MTNRQLLTFALIGFSLSIVSVFTLDYALAGWIRDVAEGQDALWTFITDLGDSKYMAILLVLLWIGGYVLGKAKPTNQMWPVLRKKALLVFAAVASTGLFVIIVKIMVGRARPYMGDLGFYPMTTGSDFASWPSGHTTSVFAFAVATGLAVPVLRWPLIALATLAGISRMVLNMHYLGDVIMGATIGSIGAIWLYQFLAPKLNLK